MHAHWQRDSKSRVGLAGAGMGSGRMRMDRGVANHVRPFGRRDEETNGGIDTNPHRANGHGMGTGLGIDIGIASYVLAKWARGNPSTQGAEE